MFTCFAKIVVVTSFLWLTKYKGCAGSKIISSPQQLYVLDGGQGTVRCQNRSDNGEHFYSYITDAVWYRYYDNGSNVTISAGSGTVYSRGYTLKFNPLLAEDQGHYFCCTQSGQCSETLTTATISTPPTIKANSSNYTAEVGSEITLACSIINQGVPIARFRWIRDGIEQLGDNVVLNVSLGLFTMTLPNLTMNDGGAYTCMATSARSSRSDHIVLNVSENVEANINNTDYNVTTRRVVQLSVTFAVSPCQTAMTSLSESLSNFVQTQYDHSVIVTVNQTECINKTTAIFELTLTGPVANHTLHHLLNDMNINANGLDIGIGVIKVCEQNCTGPTVASGPNDDDDGDDEKMFIMLIFIVLMVAVALFLILIIMLCLIIYKRRAHNTDNNVVIMNKIDAITNVMENGADARYNTLQYHTNAHNSNNTPKLVQKCLPMSSGYVEPNSMKTENNTIIRYFPLTPRAAKIRSSQQKPVVVSTPNGTGIVKVGNLKAVIPSNHTPVDLDDLKIVPSPTHESYVDVVKQSV